MTNFEFYKDEIAKIVAKGDDIALLNGKPVGCNDVPCDDCDRNGSCYEHYIIGWLYAEHVEKPKINKRTKMFFDAIETGWVTRDTDGTVFLWNVTTKPKKIKICGGCWLSNDNSCFRCISCMPTKANGIFEFLTLDFIKWEDEKPWRVEDIRNLEVED